MAHTYTSLHFHVVFATAGRRELLPEPIQERLWPYLGGIARQNKFTLQCAGGAKNHVHLLLDLPAALSVAKAVQLLKGGSSKWLNETFRDVRPFSWQVGYGAFSVSTSGLAKVKAYISAQKAHHRRMSFEQEYLLLLKAHEIVWDERYVWG
jgi:REP element-mobilizing transposase RayT